MSDQGLGIPPQELERVFESFHRVEAGEAARINGTGLGLAISREIIQRLGGTIHVQSELGKGSTFIFTLPLAPVGTDAPDGDLA